MRRSSIALAVMLVGAALAFGACGDDDEDQAPAQQGGGQTLKLRADPGGALKFDKSSLSANAGKVTITLDNPSDVPHAIEVEGNGVEKDGKTVGKGESSTVTVDLKAGTYEYYCPVDGHKDQGMEGELTVK